MGMPHPAHSCQGMNISPLDLRFWAQRIPVQLPIQVLVVYLQFSHSLYSQITGNTFQYQFTLLHMSVCQRCVIRHHEQKITKKMSVSEQSRRVCNRRFIACLQQKRGRIWLFYLVIIRQLWIFHLDIDWGCSSTRQLWAPSVNISVEYPELPDHD